MVVLGAVLLLAVTTLPWLLVTWTMRRHGVDRPDLQGTGGELARHLLDRFHLPHVTVGTTDAGDHYDPAAKAVRLLPAHHDGRSLAAVAIAAHEVGHAIQDAAGERWLATRQRLAAFAHVTDKIAAVFFIAAPVLGLLARTPAAFLALVGVGIALLAVRVLMTLVTLPVEWDASFGKALPLLKEGRYVDDGDLPAIRGLLLAAAFTYLAGALIALVNLVRWLRALV